MPPGSENFLYIVCFDRQMPSNVFNGKVKVAKEHLDHVYLHLIQLISLLGVQPLSIRQHVIYTVDVSRSGHMALLMPIP
ncbi:hypothetical protein AGRO_4607 [Agrobacterium sp. ATCC 31749]|nr:hypothetical protein AGRO_4607 [Agrobacterium sp. ATCC 31749]